MSDIREIVGNTTATPMAIPDWEQQDETKADFIKNKPTILTEDDVIQIIAEAGGSGGGGEVNITVDDQLSETSTNPVQNKVITNEINTIKDNHSSLATSFYNHQMAYESKVGILTRDVDRLTNRVATLDSNKQDKLEFDTTPIEDSENPILSGGVYEAIETAKTQMRVQTLLYTATSEPEIEEIKIELIQTHGDNIYPGDHLIVREYYEGESSINVFRDHVFILRQESPMTAKTWQLISKDDNDAATKKYVDVKMSQIVVGENGVSIDGIVDPEPDTIAKRDASGALFAFNGDISTGNPADIEGYVSENEVVTSKLLQQYAIPKPASDIDVNGRILGYDENGYVMAYDVDTIPTLESTNLITSGAVENMSAEKDLRLSLLESDLEDFKENYDQIIESTKNECKNYTDEKIQIRTASIVDGVLILS